jgi:hypothetical protein
MQCIRRFGSCFQLLFRYMNINIGYLTYIYFQVNLALVGTELEKVEFKSCKQIRPKRSIPFSQKFLYNYSKLWLSNGKLLFLVKLPPLRFSIQNSFIYSCKRLGFPNSLRRNKAHYVKLKLQVHIWQVLNWNFVLAIELYFLVCSVRLELR